MKELLLGSGHQKIKVIHSTGKKEFEDVTTLDINIDANPDVLYDLNVLPYPFEDDEFDEIHAYEVMEHVGIQGDWVFFFAQMDELARILKDKGLFFMSFPKWNNIWAFGDPGHTRVLCPEMFQFLDRDWYNDALGNTAATDYRSAFTSHWKIIHATQVNDACIGLVLQNHKDYNGNQTETKPLPVEGREDGGQDVHEEAHEGQVNQEPDQKSDS